jgi:hypothetical protein
MLIETGTNVVEDDSRTCVRRLRKTTRGLRPLRQVLILASMTLYKYNVMKKAVARQATVFTAVLVPRVNAPEIRTSYFVCRRHISVLVLMSEHVKLLVNRYLPVAKKLMSEEKLPSGKKRIDACTA